MVETETVLLGVIELNEAKRIRSRLEDRGVHVEFRSNPATCTTGKCGCTVEVHVPKNGLSVVQAFMLEERQRNLGDLQAEHAMADEGFDPEKATAKCPACGTEFSTTSAECPDCGLVFAVSE